jgi:hypothetical protein
MQAEQGERRAPFLNCFKSEKKDQKQIPQT